MKFEQKLGLLFLLTSMAVLLSGCAKSQERGNKTAPAASSQDQSKSLIQVQPVTSFTLALEIVRGTALSCDSPEFCPAAVGMFLAADRAGGFAPDSNSVGACTAVLVGEDLALTNSHCIPSAVKLLPDLCSERVRLVLPQTTDFPEENLACKEFLGASVRETAMSPDLALIRLERKTGRTPLTLDRSGIPSEFALRSFRVNPDLKNRAGNLVSDLCKSVAGSYRMPVYQSALDSVFVAGDCAAIPGNSGSPVVGSDGKLRGLLQADLPLSETARSEWGKHFDGDFARLAMGTSLRCLNTDPATGVWDWNSECITINEQDVALARPRIRQLLGSDSLTQGLGALLLPFLQQSNIMHWERQELTTSALERHETLAPRCYAPAEEWKNNFQGELPESAELTVQIPRYSLALRFNRYLQLQPAKVAIDKTDAQTFQFSPRKAAIEGSALFTPAQGAAVTLPVCSEN